ncbi:hypothetical protein ANCCAN_07342 [Ancylostoma caninum]|nr:hypothetical protein ANCCAN_07342 [Ancylostoma caninum]
MHLFARNQSQQNIQNICSDYDKFSTCFTQEHGKLCGYRSEIITGRMFHNNREAMFNMLKIRWSTLPSQCGYSHLRRDTYSSEKYAFFRSSSYISSFLASVSVLFSVCFS